ncbi:MAG: phospholipase [Oleiphilus sp.]|nr:MAG: phospholipase [Oleiphilus sp.]
MTSKPSPTIRYCNRTTLFKHSRQMLLSALGIVLLQLAAYTQASTCLERALIGADDQLTVGEIKKQCEELKTTGPASERLEREKLVQQSAFVITPHRQNYMLLGTYNDRPNQAPWTAPEAFPEFEKPLQHQEAKLQISFKVPLLKERLLVENDNIYFGFTLKSFWQMYNKKLSAPFRETNYRPEIFYRAPLGIRFMDGEFVGRVGFEHESNGRSQFFSRSWNRIYAGLGYHRDNWVLYLQPWYRLPESQKVDDGDPDTLPPAKGDDNPNIDDYMGYYEFYAIYKNNDIEVSSMFRQHFSTGKGAYEAGISFPLFNRIRGYVQYFNGYGESLIDYDHSVQRIGIGVLLTDYLRI